MAFEYYRWFPVRYRADTGHLTLDQDGAYRRLIDHYMETEQSLPDDDAALARIVGVPLAKWKRLATVLRPLFRARRGRLLQRRCEHELATWLASKRKRSASAKNAASKRWKKTKGLNAARIEAHVRIDARGEERRGKDTSTPPSVPPLEVRPNPNTRLATALPRDWTLPNEWRERALAALRKFGLPEIDIALEAERFRNHWHGKGGAAARKRDWPATWVNWCIRAAEDVRTRQRRGREPPAAPTTNAPTRFGRALDHWTGLRDPRAARLNALFGRNDIAGMEKLLEEFDRETRQTPA